VKIRVMLLAALLVAAGLASAQHLPPGKWWRKPELVRELELTRDQQEKLDEVFRGAANELIDTKAEIEKLHVAIRNEVDRSQLRRAELTKLAGQLSQARGKLFERELMMLVDMRGALNEDQWNKLRAFLEERQDRREHRGPPGMGGPPPGRRP
jgi:Spy/CpxP family protein refolding chaperone